MHQNAAGAGVGEGHAVGHRLAIQLAHQETRHKLVARAGCVFRFFHDIGRLSESGLALYVIRALFVAGQYGFAFQGLGERYNVVLAVYAKQERQVKVVADNGLIMPASTIAIIFWAYWRPKS